MNVYSMIWTIPLNLEVTSLFGGFALYTHATLSTYIPSPQFFNMANIAPASSRTVRTLVRSGAPHLSSSPSPSSEAPPPPPRLNRKAAKAVRLVNSKKKYLEVRRGQFVKMANPDAFTTAPPLEIVRRLKTVIEKSERDERVNISTTLTDVKT